MHGKMDLAPQWRDILTIDFPRKLQPLEANRLVGAGSWVSVTRFRGGESAFADEHDERLASCGYQQAPSNSVVVYGCLLASVPATYLPSSIAVPDMPLLGYHPSEN